MRAAGMTCREKNRERAVEDTKITRIRKELEVSGKSSFRKYQDLFVGSRKISKLLIYEFINLFISGVPGALGIMLRSFFYPMILGYTGRKVSFGHHIVMRHPWKIRIGSNTVIDDYCLLDAKGQTNEGISLGRGVFVGRNTILSCKNGSIRIGDGANIGFNCEVFSSSNVTLGKNVLMAAYCYIVGGGHEFRDISTPVVEQKEISSGINISENVWFGAGAKVLDGVSIGQNAVIGAGAVVTGDIPGNSIAVGIPARVVKERK